MIKIPIYANPILIVDNGIEFETAKNKAEENCKNILNTSFEFDKVKLNGEAEYLKKVDLKEVGDIELSKIFVDFREVLFKRMILKKKIATDNELIRLKKDTFEYHSMLADCSAETYKNKRIFLYVKNNGGLKKLKKERDKLNDWIKIYKLFNDLNCLRSLFNEVDSDTIPFVIEPYKPAIKEFISELLSGTLREGGTAELSSPEELALRLEI